MVWKTLFKQINFIMLIYVLLSSQNYFIIFLYFSSVDMKIYLRINYIRFIIKIMIRTIHIFLLVLLASTLTQAQKNYSMYTNIDNPDNLTNVVFLSSLHIALLYGQSTNIATAYHTYDWSPVDDSIYTEFHFAPSYAEAFKDGVHKDNLIFSNNEGRLRQKSFTSAGSVSWSLWTLPDDEAIKRATASSDGKLYAAFSTDSKLYVGNLSATDSMIKQIDYSAGGPIESIKWLPQSHSVYIAGGLIHQEGDEMNQNDHYLKIYDVESKQQDDISFISQKKIMDMAFNQDGTKLYFFQEYVATSGEGEVEQTIWVHDLVTKGVREFVNVTADDILQSINVKGNFLSVSDGNYEYFWSLVDGAVLEKRPGSSRGSGLSDNGSVLVSISEQSSTVYLVCADPQHYYYPDDNTCPACRAPCDICFEQGAKCATCTPGFLIQPDFTCPSCSSFMDNCALCSSETVCTTCAEGYDLDGETKLCQESSSGHIALIIIIIVAAILVVVVVIFLWRRHQKAKKAKHVETSLESQNLEDYEKVQD